MRILLLSACMAVATAEPTRPKSLTKTLGRRLPRLSVQRDRYASGIFTSVRGGSTDPSSGYSASRPQDIPDYIPEQYQSPPPPQQQQQPESQQQQEPIYDYEYPAEPEVPSIVDDDVPFQETFQDRVDNWRKYQLEHAEEQRSSASPRDDQGRMKLLTSVGKGSRAITFFILMWRCVHHYEVFDAKYKGNLRFMGVLPLTFLFVANMAGAVVSLTTSGHSAKKRLKAILNLNKLVEVFLIMWHVGKLIFSTNNLVPRETYISNIIHSMFFILQCQTVTRFVWEEALVVPSTGANYPSRDFDDDYEFQPQRQSPPPPQDHQQPIQTNPNYQNTNRY